MILERVIVITPKEKLWSHIPSTGSREKAMGHRVRRQPRQERKQTIGQAQRSRFEPDRRNYYWIRNYLWISWASKDYIPGMQKEQRTETKNGGQRGFKGNDQSQRNQWKPWTLLVSTGPRPLQVYDLCWLVLHFTVQLRGKILSSMHQNQDQLWSPGSFTDS